MKVFAILLFVFSFSVIAQVKPEFKPENAAAEKPVTVAEMHKYVSDMMAHKWYEKIQLRGYTQLRYNRLFESNNKLTCTTCDSSMGKNQGFFIRRGRLIFFGDVNDRLFIYIQPDFSNNATSGGNTQQHYFSIRDAYFDYHLSEDKEWRIRAGMQKIIYGFENMNSSGNRATLDRSDAINTAVPGERDLGLSLFYAPAEIRRRFKDLATTQFKGSGDYGLFGFSVYNGQSINRGEANNDLHRAVRLTYPWKLESGQYIEASIQAYEGKFNTRDGGLNKNFYDARQAATFVLYPQPFGLQAEYNIGQSPEYDASKNKVRVQNLKGGYALVNYALLFENHRFHPYVRYQEYNGGYKIMTNAASGRMREIEVGTEWQPNTAFELTVAYATEDRLYQSSATNKSHEKGNLLRLQAQFNY